MDTTNQPTPHLTLRAAKKLNPKLQCWRWAPGYVDTMGRGAISEWSPIDEPRWLPHCIYALTNSRKEKPTWAPSQQQLKDASSLKKSTAAGKKPTHETYS